MKTLSTSDRARNGAPPGDHDGSACPVERSRRRGWSAAVSTAGLGTVMLLAACSGSSDSPAPSAASAPATTAAAGGGAATVAARSACAAAVASDWVHIPGLGDDAPPPAADLAAWATRLEPQLTTLRAGVPATLTGQVDALTAAVRGAKNGTPINTDDPALNSALTAVDAWAHDSCGFSTLDVTNSDGSALAGVPATLPAGPVAMTFANTGTDPAKAGFILLLARVHDGQTVTAADVQAGRVNVEDVADVVAVAQPTGSDPAYGLATLRPGRYVVSTPIGTPPEFTGVLATGFEIR